ncbi:glycosyltransferase 87 family protein [Granulicella paludicola]|uniref:glycosyltransferase 87 family protein n=1 Tax=Granulicella paludicola TaxID=474951 RepID=UPI0021DFCD21|nr:glycosyltransferase 87 family protein [Granulicella paludicola]
MQLRQYLQQGQERLWAATAAPRTLRAAKALVAALAILFAGLFLWAAVKRMLYPFELEWIESGILVSVLRIVHGQALYVAPTLDYVPYLYAPLYLYVSAAITKLVGVAEHGYLAMRLVSTLSTLGSGGAIYALVRSETPRRIAAVAAVGLYLASYAAVGGFFDIGRVDSLFVFLLLLALLLQRRGYPVVAALVWVLVFQTKQTVLPLAFLILLAEWPRPKRMFAAMLTFGIVLAASVAWLNHATGGWYGFYIFGVVRGLPLVLRQAVLFVPLLLLGPMAAAWALIVAAVVTTRIRLERAMFFLFVSFALFVGIWFVEAHRGASMNSVMPVYAWTAVLFGIAIARLMDVSAAQPRLHLAVLLAVAVQLVAMIYNPGRLVPPADAVQRSQAFVQRVRALSGDVYVLNHSYDAILAGKQPHAEGEALGAVLDAKLGSTSADLRAQLNAAMASHRYSAVVVDALETKDTSWGFEKQYPLQISTGLANYRYLTSEPQWFLLPCGSAEVKTVMREDSVESRTGCEK